MKQIIYILIFIIVCTSCIYSSVTHLSKDDRKWVDCFYISSNKYFESDSGIIDTLYVTDKYINNSTSGFYISEGDDGKYEANSGCYYSVKHQGNTFKGRIGICRITENDSLQITSTLKQRYTKGENGFFKNYISIKPININLKGVDYDSCFIFDENNSEYPETKLSEPDKIVKYIYSKHYGLIYYKFENGEEYFLRRKK